MIFKSIRFRALSWYVLILTLTLLIFSFILYEGFRKNQYDDLDDLLSSRAEGVADSINTYWHGKTTDNFLTIAANWVEEKRKEGVL